MNILTLFTAILTIQMTKTSVMDWLWHSSNEMNANNDFSGPLVTIPYESLTQDEQFLKEAAKLETGIRLSSPLEMCQHKVILKIKTSCSSMSEEELAKLSVNLLNCQSEVEGRRTFSCSENMSIKQCTLEMDANTWNAYHLISNRARAVCYAARSLEFRSLTEITVNKLMKSAHLQIEALASIKDSHERLEEQTTQAHDIITSNIKDLNDEKILIKSGHAKLAEMTEDIKSKLEKASQELERHSSEHSDNFREILRDLGQVREQTTSLWEKIETETANLFRQNRDAADQFEKTLDKLERINKTVHFIWNVTNLMHDEISDKLGWITDYIGTTGENLYKLYRIGLHAIYILTAMIVAAFLHAPLLTRTAIVGIIPLNLAAFLKKGSNACLDFTSITVLIVLITGMYYVMNGVQKFVEARLRKSNKIESRGRNGSQVEKVLDYVKRKLNDIQDFIGKFYLSMKEWSCEKWATIEELSCSYSSTRKYYEHIIPNINTSRYDVNDEEGEHFEANNLRRRAVHNNTPKTNDNIKQISSISSFLKRNNRFVFNRNDSDKKFDGTLNNITLDITDNTSNNLNNTSRGSSVDSKRLTPIANQKLCSAVTRSGSICRLNSLRANKFCHVHLLNSSTPI